MWLTFDVEIHWLADISSYVIADSTQVEATVFFQHVLDEQRAIDQHLNPKAWVEGDGFELRDPGACQRAQSEMLIRTIFYSIITEMSEILELALANHWNPAKICYIKGWHNTVCDFIGYANS